MDEGAARTSSAKEAITASRTESSATDSQSQHQTQLQQQHHLHHSPSHLSAAMCLNNFSGVLDPFFFNNNNRTPTRQKRQRTTAGALLAAAEYDDDEACVQQKRANVDVDILSMLEDPKGVAADGLGRSFEALDDALLLSGKSWSDMVQEMESDKKKSRAPRKG